MSRINTNVPSLTAQRSLQRSQQSLSETLNRLSTGLRINRGADDPSGLIASEGLRSEITGIDQAIGNSQRASNVIATTEGALNEVASLLLNIKSMVIEAANTGALSQEEISANQLQVDSAIESITRISNTTTFAGLRLLDGSLDYITSGVQNSDIASLRINQANFGGQQALPVDVDVITSARPGELRFTGAGLGGESMTLEIRGPEGTDTQVFAASATADDIYNAIQNLSDVTGVEARYVNGTDTSSGIAFVSAKYGSKAFVSVTAQGTTAFVTEDRNGNPATRAEGQDVVATINGALTTGDGLNISLNTQGLDLEMSLDEDFGIGSTQFAVTGGGSLFQLGTKVSSNQQVNIGIQSVAASKLGNLDVGFLNTISSGGDAALTLESGPAAASKIIETAIKQVAIMRGRLGAFEKNTLETNVNSLNIAMENVTASESKIRDADFAKETAELTRNQILTQAGTSVLATANSTPQSVLSLLGG
jgi:flagellin